MNKVIRGCNSRVPAAASAPIKAVRRVHMVNVAEVIESTSETDFAPSEQEEHDAAEDLVTAAGGHSDSTD